MLQEYLGGKDKNKSLNMWQYGKACVAVWAKFSISFVSHQCTVQSLCPSTSIQKHRALSPRLFSKDTETGKADS
ncbi:hypothetical protein E2C01_100292 [Portunus trituberculatus]|uniref:Uncharacterized protein n=1 Tax=Portunus trituberculatus TaxID=210409 RepID=A0A5B7KCN6_PORTR|nr:hypothetical protein [Portunus trituberculatus]